MSLTLFTHPDMLGDVAGRAHVEQPDRLSAVTRACWASPGDNALRPRPPLIVTAALDEGAFAWFEDLRKAHFPPRRNLVPAHLTLFHALPGEHEPLIVETLRSACGDRSPMRLDVRGPWFLGRGVAYRLASPELEHLRNELATVFSPWLTPQDRAPFRPHITIQNKADPADARLLLEHLQLEFEPFDVVAEALLVWRYLDGPWEAVARLPFGAP